VATGERGEIARVKVTDPSFLNWPGLAIAVPGNIIPDFPVINKSFNLSYSGTDR
jgi:Ni,Fe-hydrogenase III large subunit